MEGIPIIKEPLTLLLAKHEFTLLERRMYWAVLRAIKSEQILKKKGDSEPFPTFQNKVFRIHISELFANETNPSITDLKKAADRITSRRIIFDTESVTSPSFSYIVPFPKVNYSRGYITITMFSDVVPVFINLSEGYSQFQLKAAISLTSEYAQLLYPRLCRYLDTGFWRVHVDDLREMLNAEKYPRYSNFKQRVLDVSLTEINDRTDVSIKMEESKEGRFVKWLTFSIRKKHPREKEYQAFLSEMDTAKKLPLEELRRYAVSVFPYFNFSPKQQQEILNDEEKLNAFIRAESYLAQGVKDIEDPTAYVAASVFGYAKKKSVGK
ncbi:replication initiation protein [Larkinella insperata]|uniref:Replication initiation protein n=1 Tax=Larkinella insperata TaxID=332158 RepID=A0ABW3QMT3_9BACT